MELFQSGDDLLDGVLWGQDGGPDVVGTLLLSKARARHCADARGLEQCQAVEGICWLPSLLGSFQGLQVGRLFARIFGIVPLVRVTSLQAAMSSKEAATESYYRKPKVRLDSAFHQGLTVADNAACCGEEAQQMPQLGHLTVAAFDCAFRCICWSS